MASDTGFLIEQDIAVGRQDSVPEGVSGRRCRTLLRVFAPRKKEVAEI